MKNYKKVLLINSNLIKPPVTPIGLDYIGSALDRNGFEVELLDLNFSNDIKEDLKKKLSESSFLALGVTIRNTDDCYYLSRDSFLPQIKEIVEIIREYSDAPIIIGGGGFTVMPLEITEYLEADLGIAGDGEFILPGLLKNIRGKTTGLDAASDIKNITIDSAVERVIKFQGNSLEDYPLPGRDLVDNERYFREGGMGSIETKRGCSGKCIYCADPLIKGSRVRPRPIEKVIEELKNLINKNINYIHFCDSELNIPADYASRLLSQIIEDGLGEKIRWYSYMSPADFDEDFAKLLKRSGCEGINFGVDSAHPVILKNLGREHSLEDLKNVSKLCARYKIRFMFDLLLGGPGEDKETIKYTIDSVKKLNPTCVGLSYGIRVYPGTALSNMIRKSASMKKSLYGNKGSGKNFLEPVFYISEKIGKDLVGYANGLISGDRRFFVGASNESDRNYNYNANMKLQKAIKSGCRGAFWDILQKLGIK
jgi:radical SAM superfamily enzyme YgiQ (UPF0313 family)